MNLILKGMNLILKGNKLFLNNEEVVLKDFDVNQRLFRLFKFENSNIATYRNKKCIPYKITNYFVVTPEINYNEVKVVLKVDNITEKYNFILHNNTIIAGDCHSKNYKHIVDILDGCNVIGKLQKLEGSELETEKENYRAAAVFLTNIDGINRDDIKTHFYQKNEWDKKYNFLVEILIFPRLHNMEVDYIQAVVKKDYQSNKFFDFEYGKGNEFGLTPEGALAFKFLEFLPTETNPDQTWLEDRTAYNKMLKENMSSTYILYILKLLHKSGGLFDFNQTTLSKLTPKGDFVLYLINLLKQ